MQKKEAAQQCLDKARAAMHKKDWAKAEKYVQKSVKYAAMKEAGELLKEINRRERADKQQRAQYARQREQQQQQQRSSGRRRQEPEQGHVAKSEADALRNSKDPEVIRVLKEDDYYALLGVSKDEDKKDIRRKYRRLTAKLHPDRNKDPGAEEAFKKVTRACDCLTDPEKRKIYDQYGTETPEMRQRFGGQYGHMNAEDLFNIFAGGMGGRGGRTFTFGQNFGRRGPAPQGWQAVGQLLMQVLPILLLLSFSFFGNNSNDNSIFSLNKQGRFTVPKKTPLDTPYYVDQNFHYYYASRSSSMRLIHDQVEGQYVTHLQSECDSQKSGKEKLTRTASFLSGQERVNTLRKVERLDLSACKKLSNYIDNA